MNNILHVIQTSGPGGAEKVLLSLTQYLKNSYNHFVGLLRAGWLSMRLNQAGVKSIIIPSGNSFDLKFIKNLASVIDRYQINLVHSHLLDMNFYSSIAARIRHIPHIATEHGDVHHPTNKFNLNLFIKAKGISLLSNKVVFVSEYTQKSFLAIARLPVNKNLVIYNGVDLVKYNEPINAALTKNDIGIKEDEIVVGNIGNLYPVKGQKYLLQAAKTVLSKFTNVVFIIIGKGSLENTLRREAEDIGIAHRVRFLGFREDAKDLLKIMDIFVLPSVSEAMPLSIVEAMASMVPIIATNVGGIPEIIGNNKEGLLIPPANADVMADRIMMLLNNKEFAGKLTYNAYEKAKRNFAIDKMASSYDKIYSQLIKK